MQILLELEGGICYEYLIACSGYWLHIGVGSILGDDVKELKSWVQCKFYGCYSIALKVEEQHLHLFPGLRLCWRYVIDLHFVLLLEFLQELLGVYLLWMYPHI